jgi:hypothetical protein
VLLAAIDGQFEVAILDEKDLFPGVATLFTKPRSGGKLLLLRPKSAAPAAFCGYFYSGPHTS